MKKDFKLGVYRESLERQIVVDQVCKVFEDLFGQDTVRMKPAEDLPGHGEDGPFFFDYDGVRTAVLHGAAGMGKRHTADLCRRRLRPLFPGGIYQIPCSNITRDIARTIDQKIQGPASFYITPNLQELLGNDPVLIVLEDLDLNESISGELRSLVGELPHLCLLITTCCWHRPVEKFKRISLNKGLSISAATDLFIAESQQLGGFLFPDQITLLGPFLELTEGIPQIIKSVADIFDGLDQSQGIVELIERPNLLGIRGVEHSWRHLQDYAPLCAQLSFCAGPFDANTAQTIVGPDVKVSDLVRRLLDLALITDHVVTDPVRGVTKKWYTMSRFVIAYAQQYAETQMSPQLIATIKKICIKEYSNFARDYPIQDSLPHQYWDWQWENVRSAINYAKEMDRWSEATKMSVALSKYLLMKGHGAQFVNYDADASIVDAMSAQDFRAAGDLSELVAFASLLTDQSELAKDRFLNAIDCYTAADRDNRDEIGVVRIYGNLFHLYLEIAPHQAYQMRNNTQAPTVDWEKVLSPEKLRAISLLGDIYYANAVNSSSDPTGLAGIYYRQACRCYEFNLQFCREIGFSEGEDSIQKKLPLLYRETGNMNERQAEHYRNIGRSHLAAGSATHQSVPDQAEELFKAQEQFYKSITHFDLAIEAMDALATLTNNPEDRADCDRLKYEKAMTMVELAISLAEAGDGGNAAANFCKARKIVKDLNLQDAVQYIDENLSKLGAGCP